MCALSLLATSAAQAQVHGTVGASVSISRGDGTTAIDTQVIRGFAGAQTAQAGVSLLWPPPANINDVRGMFNGVAQATANTRTLELHALAAAGGTLIAPEDSALANASLHLRFGLTGPAGVAFPVSFFFDLDGAAESSPLPGETRSRGFGSMGVRVDGLLGGVAGGPIGTVFDSSVAIATNLPPVSPHLRADVVMESGRAFSIDMFLQASAAFNAVADFSDTATLSQIDVPLGYELQIDGVQLIRDGIHYTIAGQTAAVPEPATWALLAAGLAGLARRRRSAGCHGT